MTREYPEQYTKAIKSLKSILRAHERCHYRARIRVYATADPVEGLRIGEVGFSMGGKGYAYMRSSPEAQGIILACEDYVLARSHPRRSTPGPGDADDRADTESRLLSHIRAQLRGGRFADIDLAECERRMALADHLAKKKKSAKG